MQQISEANYYLERALETGHPHLFTSLPPFLEFLGYYRNALTSYSKCFVSSGQGKISLNNVIFKAEDDLLDIHQSAILLRHKFVAHSDDNEFETFEVVETEHESYLKLDLNYEINFPFDRLYELKKLIRFVETYIAESHFKCVSAVEKEIKKSVVVNTSENA